MALNSRGEQQRKMPQREACEEPDSLLLALRLEEGDRGWWLLDAKDGLRFTVQEKRGAWVLQLQ